MPELTQSSRYRYSWFALLLLFIPFGLFAQIQPIQPKAATKAVIIGISNYSQVSKLRFAHRDAEAFAQFLRSPAGGSVPEENIRLLTEEKATQAQIGSALSWLISECQPNDRAIIYFSGHGDVETSVADLGYLLAYDAGKTTYMSGGAIPIFMLQTVVTALSVGKQVQVILIADACRSGNLAGTEVGGSKNTSLALSKQFANEVKIMSCGPDELSLENEIWGGGHSVFSFYLLRGLRGLADADENREITLREIERYLQDSVEYATRSIRAQTPQAEGDARFVVAKVDPATAAALKQQKQPQAAAEPLSKAPGSQPLISDSLVLKLYRDFEKALARGNLLQPEGSSAYDLYQQIKDHPTMKPFHNLMRNDLAAALQDDAQKAINDYLSADPREMRKRWGQDDAKYQAYPKYLEKAAELLGEGHFLYAQVKAKEYYFSGLVLRLQGERSKIRSEKDSLFRIAQDLQEKTLKLDSTAAYAYNELGLLARRFEDYQGSIRYFNKAVSFSPKWVLPWANLCGSYINVGDQESALKSGLHGIELDSTFALNYFNLGIIFFDKQNYHEAIKYFKRTINLNPEYLFAYNNLALSYFYLKNYAMAEEMWQNFLSLEPNNPETYNNLGYVGIKLNKPQTETEPLIKKAIDIDPNYFEAYLSMGEMYLYYKDYSMAEQWIQRYIKLVPDDYTGYYLLALSQHGIPSQALSSLELALKKGYKDYEMLQNEPLLSEIRKTPAYKKLLEKHFK
jgi:tetratricopeptide (TPR) repeat protein